ncbi:MAG: murein biosynthesis integral membrane protein MurJ, partial [Alphaproteobacteria bacterium]|nr:murein biosynthesis integral membrane protein MurJ [Alphaproteobacteria bacterium]
AAWVNVTLLYVTLHRRGHLRADAQLQRSIVQVLLASAVLGAALLRLNPIVDPHLGRGFFERVLWLAVLVGGGGLVYLVSGVLFGALRFGNFASRFLPHR